MMTIPDIRIPRLVRCRRLVEVSSPSGLAQCTFTVSASHALDDERFTMGIGMTLENTSENIVEKLIQLITSYVTLKS